MSEQQINERITFKSTNIPHLVIYLLMPMEFIGVFCFLVYAVSHWHDFIGQSAALFTWLAWFLSLVLYIILAWLFVTRVLRPGIEALLTLAHGIADIHGKFVNNRIARARRELLHTSDNYVVFLEGKTIKVHSVIQEKYTYNIRQEQELLSGPDEIERLPSPVQTFRELLEGGIIQAALSQGQMILGYVNGQLRYGSWFDLYSCGIGGVSGSGKTTTVRFLLFQALLAGAQLLMIDPHIEEPEESLAAQFKAFKNIHVHPPCSEDPGAVAKRVRWLYKEYLRRKARGIKGPALIFVLDEFNAIVRRLPDELRKELADLLLTIAQEGRKFGLFAMLIGQRWSEQDLGGKPYGAAIRSSLASILAHRFQDEDQAKKLVGGRNGAACLALDQGHYYFRDTHGKLSEMVTPYAMMEDGAYIQQLLDGSPASMPTSGDGFPTSGTTSTGPLVIPEVSMDVPATAPLDARKDTRLSPRALHVRELLQERNGQSEIIEQVWGLKSSDGRPYRVAVDEYRAILAQLVGGA